MYQGLRKEMFPIYKECIFAGLLLGFARFLGIKYFRATALNRVSALTYTLTKRPEEIT